MISQENATEAFDPHPPGASRHDGLELAEKTVVEMLSTPSTATPHPSQWQTGLLFFFSQEMKRNHPPAVSPARSTDFLRSQT